MLASGIKDAITPALLGGFIACRALSERNDDPQTTSRPWDTQRDGFVMSEGVGVLVNYVNAHATSTLAGDTTEINVIKKVFKDTSSIKMNGTKNTKPYVTIDTVPNVKKQHEVHIGLKVDYQL
eukprot:Gb_11725 [translate_table: standard]